MRQLHVLGVSDDGASLLLGTTDNGRVTHRVPIDDRLRAAVRGQLATPGTDRVESALPPREIQARLRAGETAEAVAKAAGVPLARVLPYAAPVVAERQRVVDEARAVPVSRPRGPKASRPLGEAVDARLAEVAGLKPDTVEWGARRRPDGAWVVTLDYAARGGRRSASWLWQPAERELTAEDLAASRLAADDTTAKGKRPARRADRTPARRPAAAKPSGKRAAAKRAVKPATASKAATTQRQPPKRTAPTPKTKAAKPAVTGVEEPTAAPDPATDQSPAGRRAGGRVPVPSWSDVLLGVAPPPREGREDAAARRRRSNRRRSG